MALKRRMQFTDKAHNVAIPIYAHLFNTSLDRIILKRASHHDDTKRGIDYRLFIDTGFRWIPFTIQERWRDMSQLRYDNITLRVEGKGGHSSELNFLESDYLLYGVFDDTLNEIKKACLVDLPQLKRYLAINSEKFNLTLAPSGEKYLSIDRYHLDTCGCLISEYKKNRLSR